LKGKVGLLEKDLKDQENSYKGKLIEKQKQHKENIKSKNKEFSDMNRLAEEELNIYKAMNTKNSQEIKELKTVVEKLKIVVSIPRLSSEYQKEMEKQLRDSEIGG